MENNKLHRRARMVRAMDEIARCINDEDLLTSNWLAYGVADGDIDQKTTDEDLEGYCEDETFKDLMHLFLSLMEEAKKDGGLYCDGITSV